MLATRAATLTEVPRGSDWAYEVKWDGVRVLAETGAGRLRARSGADVTAAYPELAGLTEVPDAVLDGEVVVMADGVPSFEALAERMHVRDRARAARLAARSPVTFMAFDLLALDGRDLTRTPWTERRAALEALPLPERVLLSPVYPDLDDLWQVTADHGLEGVVAKRGSARYQPGRRSPDWVKATHRATRTAAVVGWRAEHAATGPRAPGGGRGRLGAVLLGAPDTDGRWHLLGRAGSGLGGARGADVARALAGHGRDHPVLDEPVPAADARGATWCEPRVVVDVAYLGRTRAGRLRQPVVRGLRTDTDVDPWEAP
ncbi:DNA ligase [Cellulomonas sp. APG4]|uniref:ATP-dependent DNA ligase n=1 Tax=Cellulomonas sp. APG4 TaxID=1538656 RepID=UPI00192A44E3|nr:DNA ligase [Cellulomonas sp. APG4]